MNRIFGICLGHATEDEAEFWLRSLDLPDTAQACTHPAGDSPVAAVSIGLPAGTAIELPRLDRRFAGAALRACTAHATGRSGRAVVFRGSRSLTGRCTVAAVLERSEIGRVSAAGQAVAPDDVLDAGAGVAPRWVGGVLTLAVSRRADGVLVPVRSCSAFPESALLEYVADPADRVDQRWPGRVDLPAQTRDVKVDHPGVAVRVELPDPLEDLLPR
jgi:hypothetical protein